MTKTPTIQQLDEMPDFKKVFTLPYDDVASFVVNRLTLKNLKILYFWIITFFSVVLNIWFWLRLKVLPHHPSILLGTLLGYILIPVALAPFHEGIHWIFLRVFGAKDIRMGMKLRQGIIYLSAHRHVLGKKAYAVIALAPLFVIAVGSILLIFMLSSPWLQWVVTSVFFVHTTMCLGDAFLLKYMCEISSREVYTWDDFDAKEAYFYARIDQKEAI